MPSLLGRGRETHEMRVEPEGTAVVDAQRLEGAAAAEQRLVVGEKTGSSGSTSPRPRRATASSVTRHRLGSGAPIAASSGRALTQRLLDLRLGIGVPDDPAADPEVDPVLRDGEGADRQREVEVAVRADRPSAPIDAPRPTGSSAAMWSTAAIFGAPVTEPPGTSPRAARSAPTSSRAGPRRSRRGARRRRARGSPSARASARNPARRPATGRSARGRRSSRARRRPSRTPQVVCAERRVPLIGIVQTRRPRRARKSSGEAETIVQPSPTSGRGSSGRSGASAAASPAGSPENGAERCWTRLTW